MTDPILITAPPDSGNIEVLSADRPDDIRLAMLPDTAAPNYQWFYFRVSGAKDLPLKMTIENAGTSSYVGGWKDYRAVVSTDGERWTRVPTRYEDGTLIIEHTPPTGVLWYAYFAPYDLHRHDHLIARTLGSPLVEYLPCGQSLDGSPMDLLRIGTPGKDKRAFWVIGRQHPGETMGSWWMEGFLRRLTDHRDPVARAILAKAVFYVVPLMNPDGARRGHLRTNAAGTDLNRAWAEPSLQGSPEVFFVREMMEKTGVDFFLDVHGDEAIANNFIAGAEGIERWGDRLAGLQNAFKDALLDASDAFQTEEGYPIPGPGRANPKIATNWVSQRFDALGMTLEMPFKDAAIRPDPTHGWSPDRCAQFGRDCLTAMHAVVDKVR